MVDVRATIDANLQRVRQQVADAAERSGRTADAVTLVAVTKYVDADVARAVVDAGCTDLGESRPQELWNKADTLREQNVHWHVIGHLQRNKVKRTVPCATLVHSGDSLRLLKELDRAAGEHETRLPTLLEVNISGDESKHGFEPDEMEDTLVGAAQLEHLDIRGLMAMASLAGDGDAARRDFHQLRELRDRLVSVAPDGVALPELSMGMSRDFEAAIEEGATLVRVGSALFEGLK